MHRLRAVAVTLVLAACAPPEAEGVGVAIHDPLALIDEVQGPLRMLVLPAAGYACDSTTGLLTPDPPDVPSGSQMDAVADVSLDVMSSRARSSVQVPAGMYTVLVRGKGTDPVTMRQNVFIATACKSVEITSGQTLQVTLTLLRISGMGMCGDGTLSPDEQCEDHNTTGGDGCSATCRTEPIAVNTTTAGALDHPSIGWARGQRMVLSYDTNPNVLLRLLGPDGARVQTPSALANDASLFDATGMMMLGINLLPRAAMHSDGRIAIAFRAFLGANNGVRVAFFDRDRTLQGLSAALSSDSGITTLPAFAFASDGSGMVVLDTMATTSHLAAFVFAPAGTSAGPIIDVGGAASSQADVAAIGAGFVVVFAAGGDVFYRRFGTDGMPQDASPVAVLEDASGTQDQPAVAGLGDGSFFVAWRDSGGDGDGSSIRARAFAASGTAVAAPFVLNTTTAGDQSAPAVAGGASRFTVAFASQGAVRARVLSATGDPVPNREQPPTTADFVVSATGASPRAAAGGTTDADRWAVTWTDAGDIWARWFPLP